MTAKMAICLNQFRVFPSAWPTLFYQTQPLQCSIVWIYSLRSFTPGRCNQRRFCSNKAISIMFHWLRAWWNVATCMLGTKCSANVSLEVGFCLSTVLLLSWANDRKTCTEAQILHPQVNSRKLREKSSTSSIGTHILKRIQFSIELYIASHPTCFHRHFCWMIFSLHTEVQVTIPPCPLRHRNRRMPWDFGMGKTWMRQKMPWVSFWKSCQARFFLENKHNYLEIIWVWSIKCEDEMIDWDEG